MADYIEVETAIKVVVQALAEGADYRMRLRMIPAKRIVERRGKWVESNPKNSTECRLIKCSECGKGYVVSLNVPYENWTEAHKFCIECGAKMGGK